MDTYKGEQLEKLQKAIKEIDGLMFQQDSIKDSIKDICDAMKEEIDIPPADLRKIATVVHKNNVEEEREKTETIFDLAETYLKNN